MTARQQGAVGIMMGTDDDPVVSVGALARRRRAQGTRLIGAEMASFLRDMGCVQSQ
jgi:hypothetical protein